MDGVEEVSKRIRFDILRLAYARGKKGTHIGPALSMTEIMSTLFHSIMNPEDIFVLSKGHGALCYYCALYETGRITKEQLDSFDSDGGDFPGQPSRNPNNLIQYSSGSLGMGLSYAVGLAWSSLKQTKKCNIFTLVGDGELNEGNIWEAALLARQLELHNLTLIVDWNGMQSEGQSEQILSIDMEKLWTALGWHVILCDGHNEKELFKAFLTDSEKKPKVILAKTIKGKGITFIENDKKWHHNFLTEEQYQIALKEVK